MTAGITITLLGCLSALGWTFAAALPREVPGELPWQELAGGGAALLMLAAFLVFLRFLTAERAAQAKERDAAREHIDRVVASFRETSEAIRRECRESSDRRDRDLYELIRETRAKGSKGAG